MPIWLERFLVGLRVFVGMTFSGVSKRLLILAIGLLVGFAGPILALPKLPPWAGETWFWDSIAREAYAHHEYKDVILAVIPAPFVCFTDFMNHVLDDDYRYADSRLLYNGIFMVLAFLVMGVVGLPFTFAAFASETPSWLADFEYSWSVAKLIVDGAVVFESGLGCAEAWRGAAVRMRGVT